MAAKCDLSHWSKPPEIKSSFAWPNERRFSLVDFGGYALHPGNVGFALGKAYTGWIATERSVCKSVNEKERKHGLRLPPEQINRTKCLLP
jgi:hypothetical protein